MPCRNFYQKKHDCGGATRHDGAHGKQRFLPASCLSLDWDIPRRGQIRVVSPCSRCPMLGKDAQSRTGQSAVWVSARGHRQWHRLWTFLAAVEAIGLSNRGTTYPQTAQKGSIVRSTAASRVSQPRLDVRSSVGPTGRWTSLQDLERVRRIYSRMLGHLGSDLYSCPRWDCISKHDLPAPNHTRFSAFRQR